MSHIFQIQTQIKDAAAVRAACQRLGLAQPVQGKTQALQWRGRRAGCAVARLGLSRHLRHRQRPVKFDNFQGRWGDQHHLDRFLRRMPCARRRQKLVAGDTAYHGDGPNRWLDQARHPGPRRCRMRIIEIIVTTKGETTVTTKGFAGQSCRDASKFIEQALRKADRRAASPPSFTRLR